LPEHLRCSPAKNKVQLWTKVVLLGGRPDLRLLFGMYFVRAETLTVVAQSPDQANRIRTDLTNDDASKVVVTDMDGRTIDLHVVFVATREVTSKGRCTEELPPARESCGWVASLFRKWLRWKAAGKMIIGVMMPRERESAC
jgi:hypothetical protein